MPFVNKIIDYGKKNPKVVLIALGVLFLLIIIKSLTGGRRRRRRRDDYYDDY